MNVTVDDLIINKIYKHRIVFSSSLFVTNNPFEECFAKFEMDLSNSDSMTEETPTREVRQVSVETQTTTKRSVYPPETKVSGIEIVGANSVGATLGRHTEYRISSVFEVAGESDTHEVKRRYTNFGWLYKKACGVPGLFLPPFPEKDFTNRFQESTILTRQTLFQQLLGYLAELPLPAIRDWLFPFLTLSPEEFDLFAREHPLIGDLLPAKPSGFLSYFSTNIPVLDLSQLKRLLEGLPTTKTPPDAEELLVAAESGNTAAASFDLFSKLIYDLSERMEEVAAAYDELRESTLLFKNADYLGLLTDEAGKVALTASFGKLAKVFGSWNELYSSSSNASLKFYYAVQNYGLEFSEVGRLQLQYKKYETDLAKADVLVAEYKGKMVAERNLGQKKKLEALVNDLKEFKQLVAKSMQIFSIYFAQGFSKFKKNKADQFDKLVAYFLDTQVKIVSDTLNMLESEK